MQGRVALAEEESVRIQQAEVNALAYILDGLEAELALERELGVRFLECDRSVLTPLPGAADAAQTPAPDVAGRQAPAPRPQPPPPRPVPPRPEPVSPAAADRRPMTDFVFLHERALTPAGTEMMTKIVVALGKTPETAPVVHEGELPAAKVHVVLGSAAMKKWFPGLRAAPGQWVSTDRAKNVLVTYSPTYILRFGTVTPAVQKVKKEMWTSLKSVLQRLRA